MAIRKISDNVWEIPREGKMLVHGIVFASDILMEKIKQDKTLEQIKNVACLPGIVDSSIAMPDAHMGYGFCVGGVAAFDVNKGIISPGGIGFDINCLAGDTKILTEFGQAIKIEDFEKYQSEIEIEQNGQKIKQIIFNCNLPTLNLKSKRTENKSINLFMSKESDNVYEIKLDSGLSIKATSNHPFLTKEGMIKLEDLKERAGLALNLFEGVEDNGNINEKDAITIKILGYMFGDGAFYESNKRLFAVVYGTKVDLERMKMDLQRINVNSKVYSRTRKHKIITRYGLVEFEATNYELHIHDKPFKKRLEELGLPKGNKTRQEIRVPEWIKKSDKIVKRLFLAGFFGAEMSSPKTSSKTCFMCPTVDQNKIESLRQNARNFLIDISLILEEFGIKSAEISEMEDHYNKHEEKTRIFRLFVIGEENMLRLWKLIGFEYNHKRQTLANIASLYILLKKEENNKRKEIALRIKDYKKRGFAISEVKNIFKDKINERFIERHYYENAKQRINLDFIEFNDFKKNKLEELEEFGVIFDKIKEIKKIEGKFKVYDFNIKDNHNFIANGFVVSNCGVRLLASNINKKDFLKKRKDVLAEVYKNVPSGVGEKSDFRLNEKELKEVLENGVKWAVEKKYATKDDEEKIEDSGCLGGANSSNVSKKAIGRGRNQLGTLGAGNHFLEIQEVEKIYDNKIAKTFGLNVGQIVVMIHSGSRGLGHQVASDYIQAMEKEYGFEHLPDRQLAYAPIKSELGKNYLSAMAAAANFAFTNRQLIVHQIRKSFTKYFPNAKLDTVYDICHNIAKFEEFEIDGKKTTLCVHRKGATRSFGPGRKELPNDYRKVGQPIFIPGSMGTFSYVLAGTEKASKLSFASTAHGAGRARSRSYAANNISASDVEKELKDKDIIILAGSRKGIVEEAPESYKDVKEVARVSHELGIGLLVARLKPLAVAKG